MPHQELPPRAAIPGYNPSMPLPEPPIHPCHTGAEAAAPVLRRLDARGKLWHGSAKLRGETERSAVSKRRAIGARIAMLCGTN
jgi:hypothetical protein